MDVDAGGQAPLAFRLYVETRASGGWRRLAEPARVRERWTRCGNCGGRIRAVRVSADRSWYWGDVRFEHMADAGQTVATESAQRGYRPAPGTPRCEAATPATATVPIPWHSGRIGTELAGILVGGAAGTSKPGTSKPGNSKPGNSKPGNSKPGTSEYGTSESGTSESGTRQWFPAISPARGLPGDVSDEVRRAASEDAAGFGHSHLSVRELMAYDWQQTITREAFVADRDARFPDGGRAAHAMFWAFYDHDLPSGVRGEASTPDSVRVTWPWPAWAAAGREFLVTMVRLGGVAAADLDAVRGVFWFGKVDNGH